MYGNAQVLDEELNLRWSGFLGMLFYMLLAFHINLINTKCIISIIFFTTNSSKEDIKPFLSKKFHMTWFCSSEYRSLLFNGRVRE